MNELALKFLRGARKAIAVGGFDAQLVRETSGGINPNDPLGPPVVVQETKPCRVFVDMPKQYYTPENGLVQIGDGQLYVDLLSIEGNDETALTWKPQNGDYLVYADGKRQVLSDTEYPAAGGQCVVTISTVTGIGSNDEP